MAPRFPDHFSGHAASYASARPSYPPELFAWLSAHAPRGSPRRAWDCGCGNGQASVALGAHFESVIATDPSVPQLANARAAGGVSYVAATSEQSPIAAGSIDLITIAQALHWFRLDEFYAEARRVARSGALIAAWSYGRTIIDPAVDAAITRFHFETLADWWPPERRFVDEGYASLPFPFARVAVPAFEMQQHWTRRDLLGYVGTWSAVAAMRRATNGDPVADLDRILEPLWPDHEARTVRWPLVVLAGVIDRGG